MSTRPHQPCGNAWLVTPHSCPALSSNQRFDDATPVSPSLSPNQEFDDAPPATTAEIEPSSLPPLDRRSRSSVCPGSLASACDPRPIALAPMWFSRTTSAPASSDMPSSARCLPDVKAIFHRGRSASRSCTQQLLRLLYALHELCSGPPATQHARPVACLSGIQVYSLRPYSISAFSVVSRPCH